MIYLEQVGAVRNDSFIFTPSHWPSAHPSFWKQIKSPLMSLCWNGAACLSVHLDSTSTSDTYHAKVSHFLPSYSSSSLLISSQVAAISAAQMTDSILLSPCSFKGDRGTEESCDLWTGAEGVIFLTTPSGQEGHAVSSLYLILAAGAGSIRRSLRPFPFSTFRANICTGTIHYRGTEERQISGVSVLTADEPFPGRHFWKSAWKATLSSGRWNIYTVRSCKRTVLHLTINYVSKAFWTSYSGKNWHHSTVHFLV